MRPFLYHRLTRALLAELASGTYGEGERFLSKRKICRLWNVSEPTAKTAIRHLLENGLIAAKPRSGYLLGPDFQQKALLLLHTSPGTSLPPPSTWTDKRRKILQPDSSASRFRIGLILDQGKSGPGPLRPDRSDFAALEASRAFFQEATTHECEVLYFYQNGKKDNEEFIASEVRRKQLDAVVFFRRFRVQLLRPFIERLLKQTLPVLTVFDDCEHSAVSSINFNNIGAGYDAARILLEKGHRSLAALMPPRRIDNCEQRLEGVRLGLREFDPAGEASLSVVQFRRTERACLQLHDFLTESGTRPTALFAPAVSNYINFKRTLAAAGRRIPRRLEVIGCGSPTLIDKREANLELMALDFSAAGRTAFHHIKNILTGIPTDKAVILPTVYMPKATERVAG